MAGLINVTDQEGVCVYVCVCVGDDDHRTGNGSECVIKQLIRTLTVVPIN